MRFLNKIIFINSAHIRYAEVSVDGNIHFTGTQGVGKTTLLRALLFFYNCRKDRLGIRTQGQQSFDEFYIPTPSSYIIYEVSRGNEEPPFSIILFRNHGKAAFRFVDAPYSRDWFIDELGVVTSDQLTVRQRIQSRGIDISSIIERYNLYLDILYGNRNTVAKSLYKYYLLRSRQYQSIPRIIQNVFLNERVDAAFIKNTIINSIADENEEIAVDLNFFRAKLIHFTEELKDISLWTVKNRQGIIETRRDADKIIESSHEIKAARSSLYEHCGMLNYAMFRAERDIPVLSSRIAKKKEVISQSNERINGLSSKFDQEQKKINGQIAILANNLKKAAELKREYEKLGIEEMILRAGKLDSLKQEYKQKERRLLQLNSKYHSISEKYDKLRDSANLNHKENLQLQEKKKNDTWEKFNNRETERLAHKEKCESEIRDKYQTMAERIEESLESNRELLHRHELQRQKISVSSPRKEELDACSRNIADLERKLNSFDRKKLEKENCLQSLQNAFELKCKDIEAHTELKIRDVEVQINRLETKREEEISILDHAKGSFSEWLDSNVKDWEKSIGKIADERSVLYAQNLNPRLCEGSADAFFGISLDLDAIKKEVRTPAMIKENILALDKEINFLNNSIIELRSERDRCIVNESKAFQAERKVIQNEIDRNSLEKHVCNQQIREEILKLDIIKNEEKKQIDEYIADFTEKISELTNKIESLYKERNLIRNKCKDELRKIKRELEEEARNNKSHRESELSSIQAEITKYIEAHNEKLKQFETAELDELSGAGADTDIINITQRELEELKIELNRIDKERETIAVYHNDCRRLLNHVGKIRSEKKKFEDDAALIKEKYDERRQKYELKKRQEEQELHHLQTIYTQTVESKQKADNFVASKACPPELKEVKELQTELGCDTIISTIQQLNGDIYRLSDTLKNSINDFRRRFSPNNTFKFPTELDSIDGYHRYADSLEDFVSNEKIREFQQITSNLYRDVLSRAASDFNILLGRESEIKKIINAINYDFEKKTFAGVIRRIELRLEHSTNPIIIQLQNITDFWNEHQLELGELNLFSTDEHTEINRESIKYLKTLSTALNNVSELKKLPLEQTFSLKFQIQENDNTTPWVENLRAVGSEGTDILVKAIVNILLISVFKRRAGQEGGFKLHCMMDEIGRLADENIQGILNFANERGILIVNSSPKAHRPLSYRRLYMLSKDKEANTLVQPILTTREAELK